MMFRGYSEKITELSSIVNNKCGSWRMTRLTVQGVWWIELLVVKRLP